MTTKALKIVRVHGNPHYEIRWEGGGEVPADLQGTFTSMTDAKRFIAVWQSARKDEPVQVNVVEDPVEKKRGRPPAKPIEG